MNTVNIVKIPWAGRLIALPENDFFDSLHTSVCVKMNQRLLPAEIEVLGWDRAILKDGNGVDWYLLEPLEESNDKIDVWLILHSLWPTAKISVRNFEPSEILTVSETSFSRTLMPVGP